MSAKRALVVDDSKSARAFLARILERYEITVDTAESAELAIDYLTKARPDVIFMDHLMPGMDGFQAVQSIKNNPRTATIPIMMYTSQEGELYLGQARALGAVGVLPKQIKPADVSKVLYDLRLVPDRRNREQTTFTPLTVVPAGERPADKTTDTTVQMPVPGEAANGGAPSPATAAAPAVAPAAVMTPEMRSLIESTIRAEIGELRRAFAASIDSQSDRILGEVRSLLPDPPLRQAAPLVPEIVARPSPWGWVAAAASLLAALALGWMWWGQNQELQALRTRVADLQTQVTTAAAAVRAQASALTTDAARVAPAEPAAGTLIAEAAQNPLTEVVPFGEVPLSGARVAAVRTLLERLATEGFRGIVEITTHAGRFCLTGSSPESYTLAAEGTLVGKCDLVGNPFYEALSPAARQSMEFANVAAQFRKSSQGGIDVRVVGGDPRATESAYPEVTDKLTAGDWNKTAAANNRIDIRLQPIG
jgi:CheY-like chemotaxis protein